MDGRGGEGRRGEARRGEDFLTVLAPDRAWRIAGERRGVAEGLPAQLVGLSRGGTSQH